jgi:hypothetical protein
MNFSISSVNIRILALVIGILGIVAVVANFHPLLTTTFAAVYFFAVPAFQIQEYLQKKFVGLELRGKTIFLFPIVLPLLIVLAVPFWAYNNDSSQVIFRWTTIIMVMAIVVETVLAVIFTRQVNVRITFNNLQDLFWGCVGLIFGLLLAWLL